jgi:hypothetical protein
MLDRIGQLHQQIEITAPRMVMQSGAEDAHTRSRPGRLADRAADGLNLFVAETHCRGSRRGPPGPRR